MVKIEDQFNTECHKVLAGTFDRHETIVDMDSCRAVDMMTDPEDCDGWTQQVVDRNKKCYGAKSGYLGILLESQKLEVVEITLQGTIARTREIVYAGCLDEVPRGTPEGPAADRSSEDATQVNAPDHEEGVQATTPITASRIILSMAATKGSDTAQQVLSGEARRHGTKNTRDKCWEEAKNILRGELVVGVPTTFVSEKHGSMVVHCGINFPSSGSDAESNGTGCVRMAHSDTKIMPRIKPTWYGGEMTGKRNSCRGMRWSLQGSEWKSNSKHVEHMARLWRLKLESKETPTPVTKATGRPRDID